MIRAGRHAPMHGLRAAPAYTLTLKRSQPTFRSPLSRPPIHGVIPCVACRLCSCPCVLYAYVVAHKARRPSELSAVRLHPVCSTRSILPALLHLASARYNSAQVGLGAHDPTQSRKSAGPCPTVLSVRTVTGRIDVHTTVVTLTRPHTLLPDCKQHLHSMEVCAKRSCLLINRGMRKVTVTYCQTRCAYRPTYATHVA